jgi:uncharacterized protein YcfJ
MKTFTRHAIALAAAAFATQAAAQVTLFDREGYEGRSVTTSTYRHESTNAASLIVRDNNMWEACDSQGFCTRLLPGQYPSIASMGHRNRIASIRMVNEAGPDNRPGPSADYRDDRRADYREDRRDFRRRGDERLYDAQVTTVRAVVGSAEQRCWVEREQVSSSGRPSVGGAVAGAVIGGILGHQIGSGGGRDVATVGGAVVGGAIGANVGRDRAEYQDVQRCRTVSGQAPSYWDVTYRFRGQEHRVQMSSPPGATIQVNESGEPRA